MGCNVLASVDARDDTESKLATLNKLRAHILEIQKRCTILENELAAQNRPVGSIHAVPSEILSIVFGFYIHDHPRLIRRLMLVCKQWHDVASNSPELWSSISIPGHLYEADFKAGANLLRPYIKACIKRSGISLLHIDLNFEYISSWNEHMQAEIASTLTEFYPQLSGDKICRWSGKQGWSWFIEDNNEDPPGHYSYMMELLHLLGRKDRWRSLKLTYPYNTEFAGEILSWLAGSFPNLKYLSLSYYPSEYRLNDAGASFDDLSTLESLKVPSLRHLNIVHPPSCLKHLEIKATLNWDTVDMLNRFIDLSRLTVSPVRDLPPPPGESITLKLPKLHTLRLVEPMYQPDIKYELPEMQDLHLIDLRAGNLDGSFPDLQPVHVHWYLDGLSHTKAGLVAEKILTEYTRARSVSTAPRSKDDVLEIVKQLKLGGKLGSGLETLTFKDKNGVVDEVIHVDNL